MPQGVIKLVSNLTKHSITISVYGAWEAKIEVQVSRRELHTYIHFDILDKIKLKTKHVKELDSSVLINQVLIEIVSKDLLQSIEGQSKLQNLLFFLARFWTVDINLMIIQYNSNKITSHGIFQPLKPDHYVFFINFKLCYYKMYRINILTIIFTNVIIELDSFQ